jgi:hypothetical protein
MPEIDNWLHYRCVDVSTVKELVRRWYPGVEHGRPTSVGQTIVPWMTFVILLRKWLTTAIVCFATTDELKKPAT